jgi:C1A family cysteine protease
MMNAIATIGPLAVVLNAGLNSFQLYASGVYSPSGCSPSGLDHVVTAIGYGTTSTGQAYWLLKNQWGTDWGMEGYMYIARGVNMCGIESTASYPVI